MLKFLPMVVRNALRNRARTVLTVGIVMLGTALLFGFLAVERSIDRTIEKTASVGHVVVQEQFRRWPTTSLLFDNMAEEIRKVPHVVATMPVIIAMSAWRATVTKSFRLDGIDKDRLLEFWNVRVPPEQLESFLATENGMLVGRRVYDAYRWPLGTTVQLGVLNEAAAVVCGVYDAGGSAIDSRAFAGRTFVQRALNKQGIVHNILAKVDGLQNVDGVIEKIDKGLTLSKKTESVSESSMYADLVKELADMRITAALIAAVALLAVFFGIWNAVSMTVRDRIREFGVLRSVGFTRPRIAGLILMEGGAIAFAGGLLALPLIVAGVAVFRSLYGELHFMDVVVPVEVDAALLAFSLPVAVGVGVLSSLVPAIGASAKPVVEALRSVE